MSRVEERTIPKFLEGETLPEGCFDEPNPYKNHPESKLNLKELGEYIKRTGKKSGWDLTKEEIKQFQTA